MIYEFPEIYDPIRQGDIFVGLPRIDFSLNEMILSTEAGEEIIPWEVVAEQSDPVSIIVSARPVTAIVATQDCDAVRSRDITLCEIGDFREIEKKGKETTSPKSWKNLITQQTRINQKWFYLPPDSKLGFDKKMAVDFLVTLRVPREGLEGLRNLRKGRLNTVADEHFRERIGQFYRRYPYDEWYPLNHEELNCYMQVHPDIKPFPWQKP